jgi:eukaryotic-like serine/threonine-protein kinase
MSGSRQDPPAPRIIHYRLALAPGTRLGVYEVIAQIGEGGMGQVYRARDTKLQRDVALKVLPHGFAADPDRVARFRREAHVLAALNHPNIAQIYGVEEAGSGPALVLELVEGPTLADRIAHARIEIPDALHIARQIALALEAAHSQSIIHRDLKPANVKVRDDGTVKVLDFGLAKAFEPASRPTDEVANSPTITNRATALGIILGTAAYMAPEQAKGKPVDRRADIWAFGVVLYEMLTGRRLFKGEDVSDTLADVLKTDPDWRALPADTLPSIQRLLRRCLARDPNERLHDIADARLEMEEALRAPSDNVAAATGGLGRRERWLWLAALVATGVVSAASAWWLRRAKSPQAPETRLHLVTSSLATFAVAPDGRAIAYWATGAGKFQLWLRRFDDEEARALPGTEASGTGSPLAWSRRPIDPVLRRPGIEGSADRRRRRARAASAIHRIRPDAKRRRRRPAHAGERRADCPRAHEWRSASAGDPRGRAAGRPPVSLLSSRRQAFPVSRHGPARNAGHLPRRARFSGRAAPRGSDTESVFLGPHFVVFGRQDTLFAQRLNLQTLEMEGPVLRVADNVQQPRGVFGLAALAASAAGTLAYRQAIPPARRLTWLDRSGNTVGLVGGIDAAETESQLRISADGRAIAFSRRVNGNTDVWTIVNSPQGALQRVTSNPAVDANGVWSADARQIAFQAARKGGGFYDLYLKPVGGSGEETLLLQSDDNKTVHDWSRDNRFLLYGVQGREQVPRDLWAMSMEGEQKAFPVTKTPFDEVVGRFSPDTKWVAYQSTAAGSGFEIYVRPFPGPGREWRLSTGGGTIPNWRGDGRELYYVAPGNRLMAVPLTLPATGDALEFGAPVHLFTTAAVNTYAPAADGQRFLVNQLLEAVPTAPITVVLNWRGR